MIDVAFQAFKNRASGVYIDCTANSNLRKKGAIMLRGILAMLVLVGVLFWAVPGYCTDYYVAKTGNDSNAGTEAAPWLTIQKAANTLQAGDTVYIKAGTYGEQVKPQNSGTSGNLITYSRYSTDVVTLDGTGLPLTDYEGLFHIESLNYITISGLR
ncbi:MAG: DUF1565 domain-containing protein, partial [bacterium]|nr:DUF1565 domain-containing protein [bacterium]